MLSYITLGTNDLEKDAPFYDAIFEQMGYKRLMKLPRGIFWGEVFGKPSVGVMMPFDGEPASVGNGTMVALNAKSREEVEAVWKLAQEHGAIDEGAPGERMPGFFAAYFRTTAGHKFAIVKLG
jgi:predicted lactoylglutathione lyase